MTPNEQNIEQPVGEEVELPIGDEEEEIEGEEAPEGEEESAEDLLEAKRIYKLLKDPTSSKQLVRELARAEGLLGDDAPTTKKEVAAAKASIKDILKNKLGDKYEFLIPQLGEALEEILAGERETQQSSIQQMQIDQTRRDTTAVLSQLAKETKGESRKVESRMLELMNEFQIGPGVSIDKYLRGLYAQASSARDASNQKNQKNDKIRRNANDAPSRLQSSSGTESSSRTSNIPAGPDPNKSMTLKESVAFAVAQQSRQGTRK